jgi:hypothetical protein
MDASFAGEGLAAFAVKIALRGSHLEISSRFTVAADCELNALKLFPAGTNVSAYDLINFRNRHMTPHTWPELNLGGSLVETTTYSNDWQFAPHPTMFVLGKDRFHLLFGALDLPHAFGMSIAAKRFTVESWLLDYGKAGFGLPLKAGEEFQSPRFALILNESGDVYETIGKYTSLLTAEGLVPDPASKRRFPWHTEPLYCTWIEQGYRSETMIPAELAEQGAAALSAKEALDERLVRQVLDEIERQRLPFRTILLDEGWEVTRGQWEPHPKRFPDLRKLVDDIHARDMKVIVWWNWAEIFEDASVETRHLIGGGKRNVHGALMRDYSHPATQDEYLAPLFHRLFSSDPGCYDLDGIKTDFQADKVHADMPVYDPDWRGEENYFVKLYALFMRLLRQNKPDACHIGCAGHPFLAQYIDINRTYDVSGSDVRQHINRALMLEATCPGTPVALDFHNLVENFDYYFDAAKAHGWSVEIGNILGMRRDYFSPWEPANQEFIDLIRKGIS